MAVTVTCAPGEASAVSASAFAGKGGASELPSADRSSPPEAVADDDDDDEEDDDEDDVPDAVPEPPSPEAHPASRTAASRTAGTGRRRLTTPRVPGAPAPGRDRHAAVSLPGWCRVPAGGHVEFSVPPANEPPSSSGPGRRPFKAVARVRTPLGARHHSKAL